MKNILFLAFLILGITTISQAQTKLIGHKSHSGSKANFKTALDNNLFDMGLSDFGEPDWFHATQELDSVVYINESTVYVFRRAAPLDIEDWGEMRDDKKWEPFIDTLINHPLFSQKDEFHKIRYQIRQYYDFRNQVDEVKYIGYDNVPAEAYRPRYTEPVENNNTPESYTPLNIDAPKECTKPVEEEIQIEEVQEEKIEEPKKKRKKWKRKKKEKSSFIEIEKPKAILVSNKEEIIDELPIIEMKENDFNYFGTIGIFSFLAIIVILSFQYFKKS